jgi:hypothetical protein
MEGIILKRIFKKWCEGVDWIQVVPDRAQWLVAVNIVMNLLGCCKIDCL